jgi:hypothetical protein
VLCVHSGLADIPPATGVVASIVKMRMVDFCSVSFFSFFTMMAFRV